MKILSHVEWRGDAEDAKCDVSFVPPLERRRLTQLEKAAISVARRACGGRIDCPVVFASRYGEINTTLKLMRQMHGEGEMSPAAFSNSVHNAAPGHLSLLAKNTCPYTAVAAGEATREMGLAEASSYPGKVLFVYAEEATPQMYRECIDKLVMPYAEAMLIEN